MKRPKRSKRVMYCTIKARVIAGKEIEESYVRIVQTLEERELLTITTEYSVLRTLKEKASEEAFLR